jgi:sugar lactone lactonase YvrE
MKLDVEDNVYRTGPGGLWIFDNTGTPLGTIAPGAQTANVAWGDADRSTL